MNREIDDTQATSMAANHCDSSRVEVSGWDARENFFVEKTSLDGREQSGKTVALRATLRLDSELFVRLLRPLVAEPTFRCRIVPCGWKTEAKTRTART